MFQKGKDIITKCQANTWGTPFNNVETIKQACSGSDKLGSYFDCIKKTYPDNEEQDIGSIYLGIHVSRFFSLFVRWARMIFTIKYIIIYRIATLRS